MREEELKWNEMEQALAGMSRLETLVLGMWNTVSLRCHYRRQYVSLDVCTRMTPSLCLKDRTVTKTVMDSDFGASAKGELGSTKPTDVRTLTIDCEPREADRCVIGDYWKGRQSQHIGLGVGRTPTGG